jgi:hypothetical protein
MFNNNYGGFGGNSLPGYNISTTYSNLLNLISSSSLVTGQKYLITDSSYRIIIVEAISSSQLNTSATWLKSTNLTGFGWVRLTGGSSGSVNSITVNSINLMTSAVNYTTSLNNTASLVAANITANNSSAFRAIAILDTIVLIQRTASASNNGNTVSGNATTITLGNIQNITNGHNPSGIALSIEYDISSDKVISCLDPIYNNFISMGTSLQATLSVDPFNEFRWGDPAFVNNYSYGGYFKNNFFISNESFVGNIIYGFGSITNNIGTSAAQLTANYLYGDGSNIDSNLLLGSTYCALNNNTNYGLIFNNILTGPTSFIYGNSIIGIVDTNGSTTGSISNNVLTGDNSQIDYNKIYSSDGYISNNKLSGSGAAIILNDIFEYAANINNNTLSGATNPWIRSNNLIGESSSINNNTLSAIGSVISYNNLNGYNTSIKNNSISNTNNSVAHNHLNGNSATINSNTITCNITDNKLNGNASAFTSIVTSTVAISNIILDAPSSIFSSFTVDSTITNGLQNIHWTNDNRIIYNIIKTGLTGSANNGLNASPINLGILPLGKIYTTRCIWEGSGLTGVGSSLQAGIETDGTAAIFAATAIGSLNAIANFSIAAYTKTTVSNRKIQVTPSGANVTGGSFQIMLEFKISNF